MEVTTPSAYDYIGTACPHGLYDPYMGPTNEREGSCPTCGNGYFHCPGHAGHIEVCVPLYQPLLFPRLLQILRMKCLNCHQFRLNRYQLLLYAAKFHLLDCGKFKRAMELEDEVGALKIKYQEDELQKLVSIYEQGTSTLTKENNNNNNNNKKGKNNHNKSNQLKKQELKALSDGHIEIFLNSIIHTPLPKNTGSRQWTSHERAAFRELKKSFQQDCMLVKKCGHCKAISPNIRQDASNKIFQQPLAEKNLKLNTSNNIKFRPACYLEKKQNEARASKSRNGKYPSNNGWDSDDSNDDNFADANTNNVINSSNTATATETSNDVDNGDLLSEKKKKNAEDANVALGVDESQASKDNFMHALEVEAQIRLTWKLQPFICSKMIGTAHSKEGWGVFFMRAIPVPPSRFRPPMVMGSMQVEHSQNVYLAKIIQFNDRLRTLFAKIQGNDNSNNNDNNDTSGTATKEKEQDEMKTNEVQEEMDKNTMQAKAISLWIELQTTINCHIDSSKDPKFSASTPNGIRQLLEKKEGIFRKHMMGKRVNHACRSVISPDPYIGTNEIGLPLYFAKTLTYPTPVTPFNIAEMRALVRKGCDSYPGACWVEMPGGRGRIDLGKMNQHKREALAARLLSRNNSDGGLPIVGRQLRNGDMVIMNRQVSHPNKKLHHTERKTKNHHYIIYFNEELSRHAPL